MPVDATAPPKPAIPAAPVNVEESRAQRLQRQQARFRDRGGIFVPTTNRSTLVDILLGKTSPLKQPRRSASASPSRAKSTDNELSKPALRRSPRKQSQKTIDVVTEEQPPAMTDDPVGKSIKKATSFKSSKSRPQKETKATPKRTKKPRDEASVVGDSVVDVPTEKASKSSVDASEKKSLKASTKKFIPNADDDTEDVLVVKSKPKGKSVNKTKPKEVGGAKGTSKTKPATATTSTPVTSFTRLKTTRKVESIYSELSEDDAARVPTKKAATKKVKKSAPPPDIPRKNEEKGLPSRGVKASLLRDILGVANPAKSLNASDDDGYEEIKLKSKVTSSQGKPQDDSAYKPTKKSTKKVLEDDVACKPPKKSTKKVKESAAPTEKEKCKSLEEHNLVKEDTHLERTSKAAVASSRGTKRASASIAQESDSQPRRKHIKSSTTDIDLSLRKNSNLSGEAPLVTSKKRRRNPKDADSEVEDGVDNKGTKRKKHSSPSESRQSPEITVEEDSVKPVAKRLRKVANSTRKGKKQSPDNSTTASKRKENAPMSKLSKKVTSNTGPPKSVLQRIKDSLGAQVVDNEPDPIDFLS